MEKKNIFVIGLDEFNRGELNSIRKAVQYNFISLFHPSDLQPKSGIPDIEKYIREAEAQLDKFQGSVDGIIGFFDFPITLLTFYLCDKYGTTGPSLRSGIQCEHKYWSRLVQQQVIPDHIPGFTAINPFDPQDFDEVELSKPFWIKPIKAHSSQLGFKIKGREDYEAALEKIRKSIHAFAEPFNTLLDKVNLPEEINEVDGNYCIAEEIINGQQCTVSGYKYEGNVETYGIVDSVNYEDSSSFFYYLLPSGLPQEVKGQLRDLSNKLMQEYDLNNTPFNIEYYYDDDSKEIKLLEVNPRMSKSHADIYAKVYGRSNHELLVQIASGEEPDYTPEGGTYDCAAKFHYRVFKDGKITRIPSAEELEEMKEEFPDTLIYLKVQEGDKLSELSAQDSYSYLLATIHTGAESREELLEKYKSITDRLNIKIDFFNEADR
ncbi:MAG: ATP-grasp domain-containing protein [Bacteroidota bacterium]